MRSLFLKIFLSFWLAMVLVSATLIASVVTTQSQFKAMRTEQFDRTVMPLMAARAADILDDHGMGALADFLTSLQTTLHWQAYLFDDEGKEILSQPTPPEVDAMAMSALQTVGTKIQVSHDTNFSATRTTGSTGTHYVLIVGTHVESMADVLRAPIQVQIVRAAAVVFIAGFVCFWLTRYITAPILHLRAATHRLAMGNLSARVGAEAGNRNDELAELSRDFDHMAEQIESLISSQRRLLADISHELRSPLARLESGSEQLEGEPVMLDQGVAEVAADADFEAQSRKRHVRVVQTDACTIPGNKGLLRSAIENVIRNAVNYTAEGTEVEISLQKLSSNGDAAALITVRDRGRGVPEESLPDIFLPFYRVGHARDRSTGGSGLGLSITDRAIRLHGGSVRAMNCRDGGLLIELRLPCAKVPAAGPARG